MRNAVRIITASTSVILVTGSVLVPVAAWGVLQLGRCQLIFTLVREVRGFRAAAHGLGRRGQLGPPWTQSSAVAPISARAIDHRPATRNHEGHWFIDTSGLTFLVEFSNSDMACFPTSPVVEPRGIEPLTSCLQSRRSTN